MCKARVRPQIVVMVKHDSKLLNRIVEKILIRLGVVILRSIHKIPVKQDDGYPYFIV